MSSKLFGLLIMICSLPAIIGCELATQLPGAEGQKTEESQQVQTSDDDDDDDKDDD